jgi:hypothetical protein
MDNKQYELALDDAEIRLDRLKSLYEQWFQGIERLEPLIPRKNLDREIVLLHRDMPRNTRLRFRFRVLRQRYTAYITYWQRTARQIEEGTYRRDILRARRQREDARHQRDLDARVRRGEIVRESERPATQEVVAGEEGEIQTRPSAPPARQSTRARKASSKIPVVFSSVPAAEDARLSDRSSASLRTSSTGNTRPPVSRSRSVPPSRTHGGEAVRSNSQSDPSPAVGLWKSSNKPPRSLHPPDQDISDRQIREIYDKYLDARMKNKESTETVKIDKLARTVREMMPKLKKKHEGKTIDFQVVITNGKVALKPVVK